MSIVERIKKFIFGIEVVSVASAREAFDKALDTVDADEDGMLSIRELMDVFRQVARGKE